MINAVDEFIKTGNFANVFPLLVLAYMIRIWIFSYCHAVVEIST
jgi:hypothetical protein